ncbi:hypothetical protein FHS21_004535 [Phyllobacterium trifolii]|uniref:Uncharacterized protein n=1 Tax=Phyllobacterium trifolii TaxID=300193 RepID=A0A839UH19_9HYPH|nr:hypothetical protein [Phyllobacterium trifolii]
MARHRTDVALNEDIAMRSNVDFSPFYWSSIGFDRIFNLLENSGHLQGSSEKWPPYGCAISRNQRSVSGLQHGSNRTAAAAGATIAG